MSLISKISYFNDDKKYMQVETSATNKKNLLQC